MAICLNPECYKTLPSDSIFCAYCGGKSISKIQSFGTVSQIADEITAVRMQYFKRKLFSRRDS